MPTSSFLPVFDLTSKTSHSPSLLLFILGAKESQNHLHEKRRIKAIDFQGGTSYL